MNTPRTWQEECPPPWRVQAGANTVSVLDASGGLIVQFGWKTPADRERAVACAHVVAAAPALLDAAAGVLYAEEQQESDEDLRIRMVPVRKALYAALAQARGEEAGP